MQIQSRQKVTQRVYKNKGKGAYVYNVCAYERKLYTRIWQK